MPQKSISIINIDHPQDRLSFTYEPVSNCPCCHYAIVPETLSGHFVPYLDNDLGDTYLYSLCPNCRTIFVSQYTSCIDSKAYSTSHGIHLENLYPQIPGKSSFPDSICELSPTFVKVFNQASAAETYNLNEIVGGGYRKALEFLVKDYLCHTNPDDAKSIQAEPLIKSIKRISNSRIQTLAERSTWLGNDEIHYTRKHEDYDVNDMKVFVTALVSYITSELTFEAALEVPFIK